MATSTKLPEVPAPRARVRHVCESCGQRAATRVVTVTGNAPDPVRPDGKRAPHAAPFRVCAPCADLTT